MIGFSDRIEEARTLLSGLPAVYDTVWNPNGFVFPSPFSSMIDSAGLAGVKPRAGVLNVEDIEPLLCEKESSTGERALGSKLADRREDELVRTPLSPRPFPS